MSVEKELADFEAWAETRFYRLRRKGNDYHDTQASIAWNAWLARANTGGPSPEPGETERECFEAEWAERVPPLIRDPESPHTYANIADWCWLFWQSRAALDRGDLPPMMELPEGETP